MPVYLYLFDYEGQAGLDMLKNNRVGKKVKGIQIFS